MSSDLVTLLIGASVGFLSAILLEFIRYSLSKKQAKYGIEIEDKKGQENNLREFLTPGERSKKNPAWLKLIKEPKSQKPIAPKSSEPGIPRTNPSTRRSELRMWTLDLIIAYKYFAFMMFDKSIRLNIPYFKILKIQRLPMLPKPIDATPRISEPYLEKYILTQTQIIGRQKDCEIRLIDEHVSRLHALVRFEDGGYVIYDLGSTAGTHVNDEEVGNTGKRLSNKDTIHLGECILVFESIKRDEIPDKEGALSERLPQEKSMDAISDAKTLESKNTREKKQKKDE